MLSLPIEGFYLRLYGDILAVKGVLHPPGKAVATPAYVRGAQSYRRVRSLREALSYFEERLPGLMKWYRWAGRRLPTVPLELVEEVYSPLGFRPGRIRAEVDAWELGRLIAEEAGIGMEKVGVSGSLLLGLGGEDSDIDLVIYGVEEGRRALEAVERLRRRGALAPVEGEGWIRRTRGDSEIPVATWLRLERRKRLTGLFRGRLYTAKVVPLPSEYWESLEQVCKEVGRAELLGRVLDDRFSHTTPNRYVVEVLDARGDRVEVGAEVELMSMRSRFAEVASEGELVRARGRVEELRLGGRRWVRLFIGNEPEDCLLPAEGDI